jgi:shikimate kinase / 3-dehydroquinate synthase
VDVVLVGLPGAGKSAAGQLLARRLGAAFVETDREVERLAGQSIEAIFESGGEAAFRSFERAAVASLGNADPREEVVRVIATGGGGVVDPRTRWQLYRGRRVVWLDAPASVLAERIGRSGALRPLLAGQDVALGLEALRSQRERLYAAGALVDATGTLVVTVDRIAAALETAAGAGTVLLRAELPTGRVLLGEGIAAASIAGELRRLGARRAIVISEPGAWAAVGMGLANELSDQGWSIELFSVPEGEGAKRLSVVEATASDLARRGVERGEPIVGIGGGALTDVAGFVAATYQRGVPWVAVPTTLLGQLDAAHGGKTGVDLGEGKNLVGAFHLPVAVIVDTALLATLPPRQRRAALAEAVKDGLLGDERLLEVLEQDGDAIAEGSPTVEASALAEVIERGAWVKLDAVEADPLEQGDRISLNLGHTLGHAIEATAGFGPVLHGEAVAYGLRAAARLGQEVGVTPPERLARIEAVLDRLHLAMDPLPYPIDAVLGALGTDKKRRDGALRWVLPTGDGWRVSDSIPEALVRDVARSVLAGRERRSGTSATAEREAAVSAAAAARR